MNKTAAAAPALWPVPYCHDLITPLPFAIEARDDSWRPLHQAWRTEPETGFQPGWARVLWQSRHLVFEALFAGKSLRNSARKFNERTWESGDVCEVFLEDTTAPHYIEIHVTPENQRLQLRFPHDGLEAVRSGRAQLEEFMIHDADWVQTETVLTKDHLSVRVIIPSSILGGDQPILNCTRNFRAAVCRYDYRARSDNPILSSTAPLNGPLFHQRDAWAPLKLGPKNSGDAL
ncbi:hypothetical protein CMV30_18605 [Nibricoccus aquaticus]|uniref:Carbohydrate-binding domain-containing protein n=1 Tax=Nibricoccus aquaticus TaxID=2576891 RepID=A0A290QC17_9BACT|nr:hypothetical protein [Nibricoccus aquaticus]ATC65797.1 hypothetical protein CMV30_18605 [Nibricoccus aquaticus]